MMHFLSGSLFQFIASKQRTIAPVAGVITIDLGLANNYLVNLTGNVTTINIATTTPANHLQRAVITFVQDVTGGRTVEGWPVTLSWVGGVTPIIDPDPDARDTTIIETADGGTTYQAVLVSSNNIAGRRLREMTSLSWSSDKLIYLTGAETVALTSFSAWARTLLDDANVTAAQATLVVDPAGTAATAVANHEAAGDPHPQYVTPAEMGALILNAIVKTTPVDADSFVISDSDAGGNARKVTWANIKATLKIYFDTIYATLASPSFTGTVNIGTFSLTGATEGRDFTNNGRLTRSSAIVNTIINHLLFYTPSGAAGGISTTNATTAYGTASGRALKRKIVSIDFDMAINKIKAGRPVEFEFKAIPGVKHLGFIAEEMADVVPDAVILGGGKIPLMMDYGKVTPVLWAVGKVHEDRIAVLEAADAEKQVIIDDLLTRIETLENR